MDSHESHVAAVTRLLRSCAYRHDLHRLFSDCMEASAISISNSMDLRNREPREKRYLDIVGQYERDVVELFPQVFAGIMMALEAEPRDALGTVYNNLELPSVDKGQFFTPWPICQMMAEATLGDPKLIQDLIARKGFVRAIEPACGAGATVIGLAQTMRAQGVNYQRHLHVTAVDIDARVAHMAYIQFSLLHIPAVVIVGNSLSLEMRDHWYTPAHIMGRWSTKLARCDAERTVTSGPIETHFVPTTTLALPSISERPEQRDLPRQLSLF
ncbi:SAM-dependent DNA methyltransferase [Sphingobium sp.]|uniref:SAM-dependent DNA methyltransferase n=1 Tax=Sphingobium sp. TaxID=1912891 RepID=UPI002620A7B9|nr:SAM-dependent DNA methyltransferase [Sphingobium sp.]